MLILSRKTGETVVVEDDIRVTVLDAGNNRVQLGIVAPKEVLVLREEVYKRTMQEKRNFEKRQSANQKTDAR